MRKLLLFAFASLLSVGMTSCLKNSGKGESTTSYNGKLLYYCSASQQNYAMDPVDIAYRFGILLREATDAGKALEDVTVGTGTTKMIDQVFAHTNVKIVKTDNVYAITFTDDINSSRGGTWYINTKGKMLDDLSDEAWDIYLGSGNDAAFKYYDTSSGAHSVSVEVNSALISIMNNGNGGWSIGNRGYISTYKPSTSTSTSSSTWIGNFDILQANGRSLKYSVVKLTPFSLSGSASGETMFGSGAMIYNIDSPLVFTPTCSASFISEGTLTVGFDSSVSVNPEYYPEKTAKMEISGSSCKATYYITYAGERALYATVTNN